MATTSAPHVETSHFDLGQMYAQPTFLMCWYHVAWYIKTTHMCTGRSQTVLWPYWIGRNQRLHVRTKHQRKHLWFGPTKSLENKNCGFEPTLLRIGIWALPWRDSNERCVDAKLFCVWKRKIETGLVGGGSTKKNKKCFHWRSTSRFGIMRHALLNALPKSCCCCCCCWKQYVAQALACWRGPRLTNGKTRFLMIPRCFNHKIWV